MNTYSNENFTFLIVRIFISICIHFNMYSSECIERLSNFYSCISVMKTLLVINDKLIFEKQKRSKKEQMIMKTPVHFPCRLL